MDPTLKAAWAQPARTFTAVRIELPDGEDTYVVRLLNGGQAVLSGETFTGRDSRFGTIESVSNFTDGIDDQATTGHIVLRPATEEAIEVLASPLAQGAPVEVFQGAIDTDTGGVYGVELLFRGEINYGALAADEDNRVMRLELVTEEARALEPNDERRLSHSFHQSIWPGELGLSHVTGVIQRDFWRIRKPAMSYGGGYGGGGYAGGGQDIFENVVRF
ncbi:hypothetical protein [Brevundimonas sp.]|uniref:hypothetical protein n=1 Tax=Brevundimonas sp. TaxID=1871086 RepID=UPI00289917A3|nr:hypothetical protein [Brevundimonas sp.]